MEDVQFGAMSCQTTALFDLQIIHERSLVVFPAKRTMMRLLPCKTGLTLRVYMHRPVYCSTFPTVFQSQDHLRSYTKAVLFVNPSQIALDSHPI